MKSQSNTRSKRRSRALFAIGASVIVLAACGGGGGPDAPAPANPAPPNTPAPNPAPAPSPNPPAPPPNAPAPSPAPPPAAPIVAPPTIVTQPQDVSRAAGESATFSVTVSSQVPVTFQWQRNGTNIFNARQANFTIASVAAINNGDEFVVIVTNSAGETRSEAARLTVLPAAAPQPPAAPTNVVLTPNASATGVLMSWTDNANDETGFELFQVVNGADVQIGLNNANDNNVDINGLAPGSTHTFRVRAVRTAIGSTLQSAKASATITLPAAAPQTLTFAPVADNKVMVSTSNAALANQVFTQGNLEAGCSYVLDFGAAGSNRVCSRSLLQFNVATLAGRTINRATLRLNASTRINDLQRGLLFGAVREAWNPNAVNGNTALSLQASSARNIALPAVTGAFDIDANGHRAELGQQRRGEQRIRTLAVGRVVSAGQRHVADAVLAGGNQLARSGGRQSAAAACRRVQLIDERHQRSSPRGSVPTPVLAWSRETAGRCLSRGGCCCSVWRAGAAQRSRCRFPTTCPATCSLTSRIAATGSAAAG